MLGKTPALGCLRLPAGLPPLVRQVGIRHLGPAAQDPGTLRV